MAFFKEKVFLPAQLHNTHHQIIKYGPKNGKKTEEKILKNPILAVWQNETDNEAFVYWYIIFFLIISTYL